MAITKSHALHGKASHAEVAATPVADETAPEAKKDTKSGYTLKASVTLHNGHVMTRESHRQARPDADDLAEFQRESIAFFRKKLVEGGDFDNSASSVTLTENTA